jgi:electron transfer flavoprotein alpha subunit
MSRVLIVAEHDGARLGQGTARCVACSGQIAGQIAGATVDVVVLHRDASGVVTEAAALAGVGEVLSVDRAENAQPVAAVLAPQVAEIAAAYDYVLAPSTTYGKDLLPRVAALLGVAQISDVMAVEGPRSFRRPIYAGNAVITVDVPEGQKVVASVRLASFRPAGAGGAATVRTATTAAALPSHTRFVELRKGAGGGARPDLQAARIVISGGRGVGSAENFALLYGLADTIGAAVGASRAAVDAGYVPNDLQVGQTSKIISPELYLAFGISGAIQHLSGIKDAGLIVAVNKDPEAPIFQVADIGFVGDLFQIIPELVRRLG